MTTKHWARSAPLGVLALLVLTACNSSKDRSLDSQAIDGFIVKGAVSCDDEPSEETGLAGSLNCPKNTVLVTVSGGWDVGFDETAETSNNVFIGKLRAPASLGYVTPLSTVAVQMASTTEGGYQAELWEQKVKALGDALGDGTLDLKKDPSDIVNNASLMRFNAQIHQVMSTFAKSKDDYELAIAAFASVMTKSAAASIVVDLEGNVKETLTDINTELGASSGLYKNVEELDSSALTLSAINQAISAAVAAGDADKVVAAAVDAAITRAAVTIDRRAQSVTLTSADRTVDLSIDDFETSTLSNGSYMTQVDSGLVQVGYNNEVLQFSKDLNDVQVTMGFELKSTKTGDTRSLSFYSDKIRLSATKNDSDSLVISVPDGATLHAVGTDALGTKTTAEVEVESLNTFSNENGSFSVNYSSIVDELESIGFDDIFANAAGNYEMTLIIGGIQLKEKNASGGVVPATGYDISIGAKQRSGAGFKGYISYLD